MPSRVDVAESCKLAGFAEHDIQILMAVGKLTPLSDPAPNAPKRFAALEMIRNVSDRPGLTAQVHQECSKILAPQARAPSNAPALVAHGAPARGVKTQAPASTKVDGKKRLGFYLRSVRSHQAAGKSQHHPWHKPDGSPVNCDPRHFAPSVRGNRRIVPAPPTHTCNCATKCRSFMAR